MCEYPAIVFRTGAYNLDMDGNELIRRLRKLARKTGTTVTVDRRHGKGSHATLQFGARRSTVPIHSTDMPRGTLRAILTQLGLTEADL